MWGQQQAAPAEQTEPGLGSPRPGMQMDLGTFDLSASVHLRTQTPRTNSSACGRSQHDCGREALRAPQGGKCTWVYFLPTAAL